MGRTRVKSLIGLFTKVQRFGGRSVLLARLVQILRKFVTLRNRTLTQNQTYTFSFTSKVGDGLNFEL